MSEPEARSAKDIGVMLERARQVAHYRLVASQAAAGPRWQDGTGPHFGSSLRIAARGRETLDQRGEATFKDVTREAFYEVLAAEPSSDELLAALVGLETVVRAWIASKMEAKVVDQRPRLRSAALRGGGEGEGSQT